MTWKRVMVMILIGRYEEVFYSFPNFCDHLENWHPWVLVVDRITG